MPRLRIKDIPIENDYLKVDAKVPLSSQSNILEWTGKLFMGLWNETEFRCFIQSIIMALRRNEIQYGLIPRTVFHGAKLPEIGEKNLRKWEEYMPGIWYKTEVSYSQQSILAMGLFQMKDSFILENMLRKLVSDNWKIKRLDGKTTRQGRYYPVANTGLRMYIMYLICIKMGIKPRLSIFTRLSLYIFSYSLMRCIKAGKEEDIKNTYICLTWIADFKNNEKLQKKCKDYWEKYLIKHKSRLRNPTKYEDLIDSYYIREKTRF